MWTSVKYSDFSKALLLHPGVVRIELLSDELLKEIHDIEYSPENMGFMPIDSVGLIDVSKQKLKLILFCSKEFKMFTEPFMDIIDTRGRRIGHDVLDHDKPRYSCPEFIWLTENLFFDPDILCENELRCVIRSLSFEMEGLEKGVKPRVFYPCKPVADMLNQRFGATGKITATVLLGVNNVEF